MKNLATIAVLILGIGSGAGQGMLIWGNSFASFRSPIFAPDPANSGVMTVGDSNLARLERPFMVDRCFKALVTPSRSISDRLALARTASRC